MANNQDNQIVDVTTLTQTDYDVGEAKVNAGGKGKSVKISNAGTKRAFYVQFPVMLTWGSQSSQFDEDKPPVWDMSLQFPRDDFVTEAQTAALESLKTYETHLKALVIENSKTWLGKKTLTSDALDAIWTPMLKYPKDEEGEPDYSRAPTLRAKLPVWDGVFKSEIYNMAGEPLYTPDLSEEECKGLPSTLIPKGSMVGTILQSGGIYIVGGRVGTTWKLFQAVVKPRPTLYGKCQFALTSEQREVLETSDVGDDNRETVNDSDDEVVGNVAEVVGNVAEVVGDVAEEVAAEVAEVVEQAAPKKKVVRRKKKSADVDEDV
jgi:hypothetical protein